MGCMKCGRDLTEGQMFCQRCLDTMEKYPVKLNTPVQLPSHRPVTPRRSAPRRRVLSPEERIHRLRRLVRNLVLWLLAMLLVIGALIYFTVSLYLKEPDIRPGQNYSVVETTEPSEAE